MVEFQLRHVVMDPITNFISAGSFIDTRGMLTRLVDLLKNAEPKGGNVQLTIDQAAQTAAFDGLRGLGEDVHGYVAVQAHMPDVGGLL